MYGRTRMFQALSRFRAVLTSRLLAGVSKVVERSSMKFQRTGFVPRLGRDKKNFIDHTVGKLT